MKLKRTLLGLLLSIFSIGVISAQESGNHLNYKR
jgi:hypothetical protein